MLVKFLNSHSRKPYIFQFLTLAFALVFQHSASAVEIPWNGSDKIVISVTEGHWNLQPSSGRILRLEGPELESLLAIEKREGQIEIRSKDQLSKTDFGKTSNKKRDFNLQVPNLAVVDFHLLEGQLTVSRLSKEGLLHVQKGKISLKDMAGSWILHVQKGDINVADSQGRLQIDSYGAKVEVKNFNGDSDISNFAGDLNLDKVKGFMSLNQGSGTSKIANSSGTLQFELAKGNLNIQQFSGRVEGQSQEGTMNISMATEGDLNIKTQAGRVNVTTPPNSGAALNVVTQEGDLYGPSYLKVSREAGSKSLRARLKGELGKSSIFIRSQEGAIVIK